MINCAEKYFPHINFWFCDISCIVIWCYNTNIVRFFHYQLLSWEVIVNEKKNIYIQYTYQSNKLETFFISVVSQSPLKIRTIQTMEVFPLKSKLQQMGLLQFDTSEIITKVEKVYLSLHRPSAVKYIVTNKCQKVWHFILMVDKIY